MFLFFNMSNDKNNKFSKQKLDDIYEKYFDEIKIHCAKKLYLDKSFADDITQEAFEILFEKMKIIEIKNYRAWLYKTADNLLNDFFKKERRKKERETHIDDITEGALSYEQDFEPIDDYTIEQYKDEILARLTEQEQQLFNMNYIEKLSHAEIGARLSITENNVSQRLYRLKEKIKGEVYKKLEQPK